MTGSSTATHVPPQARNGGAHRRAGVGEDAQRQPCCSSQSQPVGLRSERCRNPREDAERRGAVVVGEQDPLTSGIPELPLADGAVLAQERRDGHHGSDAFAGRICVSACCHTREHPGKRERTRAKTHITLHTYRRAHAHTHTCARTQMRSRSVWLSPSLSVSLARLTRLQICRA